jgi:hypothetical protein
VNLTIARNKKRSPPSAQGQFLEKIGFFFGNTRVLASSKDLLSQSKNEIERSHIEIGHLLCNTKCNALAL